MKLMVSILSDIHAFNFILFILILLLIFLLKYFFSILLCKNVMCMCNSSMFAHVHHSII